ncbi:hypothetical protein ACTWKB_16805 [Bacillus sp. 4A_MP2]
MLTLKSLLNDVEKNGAFSGHIVTEKEQQAIRSLLICSKRQVQPI